MSSRPSITSSLTTQIVRDALQRGDHMTNEGPVRAPKRHRLSLLAGLVSAVLIAAACGGGGKKNNNSSATTSTSEEATTSTSSLTASTAARESTTSHSVT